MPVITSRHTMFSLVPKWLRGFNAYTVLYSIQLVTDELWDILMAAVKIRFQGYYSNESIPRIASERKMFQGRAESPESFAGRLSTWWDLAKRSGCFYVMAKELAAYFLPQSARIRIVTNNGTLYTYGTDGSWTVSTLSWDWDGDATQWSRFWVLLDSGILGLTGYGRDVLQSGNLVLQPTRFVGSDATEDAQAIHDIMEQYRAPHTQCIHVMPILDENNFLANLPAGNWDQWANRNNYALYWSGTI